MKTTNGWSDLNSPTITTGDNTASLKDSVASKFAHLYLSVLLDNPSCISVLYFGILRSLRSTNRLHVRGNKVACLNLTQIGDDTRCFAVG